MERHVVAHRAVGTVADQTEIDLSGNRVVSELWGIDPEAVDLGNSIDNELIFVDQFFDTSGRPGRISEPYFENSSRFWNGTSYDTIGRVTGLMSASGDDFIIEYDDQAGIACAASGPGVVVKTNALGQKSTEVKNVLGETIESFDANCGN